MHKDYMTSKITKKIASGGVLCPLDVCAQASLTPRITTKTEYHGAF